MERWNFRLRRGYLGENTGWRKRPRAQPRRTPTLSGQSGSKQTYKGKRETTRDMKTKQKIKKRSLYNKMYTSEVKKGKQRHPLSHWIQWYDHFKGWEE